jgi:putative inorganic carbon (HCO3(-)) transporter
MTLVSLGISPVPQRTLPAAGMVWAGLLLYLLGAHWPWLRPRWERLWWGLIAFGGLLCLVAPPGMLPPEHVLFRWLPLWGKLRYLLRDTFNPNVIAGALVVLLPLGLAKMLTWRRDATVAGRIAALLAGLISLAMLALLALTWSRGAYLALALGLLVFGALYWPRVFVPLVLLGLAGIIIIAGSIMGWQQMGQMFATSFLFGGVGKRQDIWSRALYLIARFPLTGVGLDCFVPVTQRLYPLPSWAEGRVYHAHNLFLQLAVDLGLPGLVAYLAVVASALQRAVMAQRLLRRAGQRPAALLAAACVASLTGLLVHGLLDVALWGNKGAFLPWVVMGLSMLLAEVAQEDKMASSLSETEPGTS